MKYINPTYKREEIETSDIILVSLGDGATLTEKDEKTAQVSISANSILGLR